MKDIDFNELYGIRILVFQEMEPQSNKYCQVFLNEEQFKAMSLTLGKLTGKTVRDGVDEVELQLSTEEYTLPDLRQIN